jgi:hypothetical protein
VVAVPAAVKAQALQREKVTRKGDRRAMKAAKAGVVRKEQARKEWVADDGAVVVEALTFKRCWRGCLPSTSLN